MQQATVNLFADMRAQPSTLQPGLATATASTDVCAPTSTITSPVAGAPVGSGTPVTVSGTAVDAGGGAVAAVEVSIDGGATWHAAQGGASLDLHVVAWDARRTPPSKAARSTTAATSKRRDRT